MAHFVRLDSNNVVVEVVVVPGEVVTDKNGQENEQLGIQWLKKFRGGQGVWRKTSYNSNNRGRYAGIGYKYDTVNDVYIPGKPFESFVWDETNKRWKPPVDMPDDGNMYVWDAFNKSWKLLEE